MSWRAIGLALVVLAASASSADAAVEPSQYVYRLVMTGCEDSAGRFVQSAFKPAGMPALITALHGIAGCASIDVFDAHGAPAFVGRRFKIGRTDVARDVAEVIADPALSVADGLPVAQYPPSGGEHLSVFGFPNGRTLSRGTVVDVAMPALMPLRAWPFPSAIRNALEERKSPDVDLEFVDIDGVLMPGHSGAPLLNTANQVVAVANGGLNRGMDHRTWATPWAHIAWRVFDEATARRLARAPESLFAHEIEGDDSSPANSELLPAGTRGTVTLELNARIPGLTGHLTPRLDGAGRAFLYAKNIAIDGGQPQPVPIVVNQTLQLEDTFGQRVALTIAAITPTATRASYASLPPNYGDDVDRFALSVLDAAGHPVWDATVQVAFLDGTYRSTLTNAAGQAVFEHLKSRTAKLLVSHPGFTPVSVPMPMPGVKQPAVVRLDTRSSTIVPGGIQPGTPVVFIVDANGGFEPTISDAIARVLDGRSGTFTSQFVSSGAFVRVLDGDLRALPARDVATQASEMLFGRSTVSYAASDETFRGLRKAMLSVTLRRYRFMPQLQTDVLRLTAAGAGFSDADALASASEHIASQLRTDRR